MTVIERLAAFIARPGRVSAALKDQVHLHLIDTVAALVAGTATPEGEALCRFAAQTHAAGAPSDPGWRLMNLCARARLSELDDIHLASMTTAGSIVIPGALAIAASQPATDADTLIEAVLGGYEAMTRLGLALDGPGILYRGIWPSYFAAPFGIAAVAARLLRLDATQTAHALALALNFAAPGVGHHNAPTTARWLAVGNACRNGLVATQAAQGDFTADLGLLDGEFFSNVYAIKPAPSALTDGLGTRWALTEVSFKPWCAARQTMPATQALKEILAEGVKDDQIVAINAAILPPHRRMIDHGVTPGNRASYLTSLPYHLAVAACAPELSDLLSPPSGPVAGSIKDLMARVTIESDDSLLADYPRTWPAHVTIHTASGTRERRVSAVPGDPARPFGMPEVTAKFRRFVAPVRGDEAAEALLTAIAAFVEGQQSASDLLARIEGGV